MIEARLYERSIKLLNVRLCQREFGDGVAPSRYPVAMSVRDVEFLILGSGTSSGVPVIGCDCEICNSDDPRDNRTRCSACVRFIDATGQARLILIDASPDLRIQALRHKLNRCDAIV